MKHWIDSSAKALLMAALVVSGAGPAHGACDDPPDSFVDWNGCDKRGADLAGARLFDAEMTGIDLTGANLAGADLRSTVLEGAKLSLADLAGAKLDGADLTGADLTGADLSDASLERADLSFADFSLARLSGRRGLPRSTFGSRWFDSACSEGELSDSDCFGIRVLRVTRHEDSADGVCDEHCSLREAVAAANARPDPAADPLRIELPSGTYRLTLGNGGDDGSDLDLSAGHLEIRGVGTRSTVVDGLGRDRVFYLHEARSVSISRLTVTGGHSAGPTSFDGGGGIFVENGDLWLDDVLFTGNSAPLASAILLFDSFAAMRRTTFDGDDCWSDLTFRFTAPATFGDNVESPGETCGLARPSDRFNVPCLANATTLCLAGDRFRVTAAWRSPQGGSGAGQARQLTGDTGTFWFFHPANQEMMIKVLDACGFGDRFWVFAGGLTDVEVELRVEDALTGEVKTYRNPQRTPFQPIQDTGAFATCP